jgi:predicted O-methyltransferase YrrM
MDSYSTHTPVLNAIIQSQNIDSVFEFGCGMYSTLLFQKHCKKVIAIEMQSLEWYEKIKPIVEDNVALLYNPGPLDAINTFEKIQQNFDLIFVDGHGDSRWQCINAGFKKTNIIVTHDVETASYNWHLVDMPPEWSYYEYNKLYPHTGVYYKNKSLLTVLENIS